MNVPPTYKDVLEDATVHTLAEVALAALASTGPLGAAASTLAHRLKEQWGRPASEYERKLEAALAQLQTKLRIDDSKMQTALGQAQAALADHGLSAWELASLGFNAEKAAAKIAERSGYHAIQDLNEPAGRILVKAIELLPEDPRQHRHLEAAFREVVLELLKNQDEQLRQQAKLLGGVALLELPHKPWDDHLTYTQLLDPEAGILPYQAHPEEQDLETWLDSNKNIALRIYAAEGGSGKTRFLLEQCQRRRKKGWQAGFLTTNSIRALDPEALYLSLFTTNYPILVVMDYAEGRMDTLSRLLQAIEKFSNTKNNTNNTKKIRVVLLTRRTESNWYYWLTDGGNKRRNTLLNNFPLESKELSPLLFNDKEREEFYRHAYQAFQRVENLKKKGSSIQKTGAPSLQEEHFKLPLFVAMAALAHLLNDGTGKEEEALLSQLLAHERRLWIPEELKTEKEKHDMQCAFEQAMACITLWQGSDVVQVGKLPSYWPKGTDLESFQPNTLLKHLESLYGEPGGWIQPLGPDRLGEFLVCQALKKWPHQFAQGAYPTDLDKRALSCSFQVLERLDSPCWNNKENLFVQTLIKRLETTKDLDFIKRFMEALPRKTKNLTPLAMAAAKRLYNNTEDKVEKAQLATILSEPERQEDKLMQNKPVQLHQTRIQPSNDSFTITFKHRKDRDDASNI